MRYDSLASSIQLRMLAAPRSNQLRDLIVDTLVSRNVLDDPESYSQEVMNHLCQAYSLALKEQAADEDLPLEYLSLEDAKYSFKDAARTYYLSVCSDDEKGAADLPEWPAGLPQDIPYTPSFIRYVGRMIGHYFAKNHRGILAYCERMDRDQQT